ncbi:LacI family DNA-binding transcriptional regulator, partial [Nonomuraea dietziae]
VVNRRLKGLTTVLMDVGQGAGVAVEHVAGLGHRRMALLTGPAGSWTSGEIRQAATDRTAELGVELTVIGPNEPTEHGGLAAAQAVAASGVTAVLCYNDLVALGLIEGLRERGVDVPGDVSVIGVDDSLPGRLSRPKLTTITMPTAAAGRMAVDLLLATIAGPAAGAPPRTTVRLETGLLIRESTQRVSSS